MATRPPTSLALLATHLFIALFCLWNVIYIPDRARVPFETDLVDGESYIGRIADAVHAPGLQKGDRLIYWKSIRVAMPQHLELLAEMSRIGDHIPITVERNGGIVEYTIELVPFYTSYRFAVVTAVAGVTILMLGLFLYFKRPGDPTALLLHLSLVSLGTLTMMTQGAIEPDSALSFLRRAMLFLSYNTTAAFFFLFTVSFPRRLLPKPRVQVPALLAPFLLLAGCLTWFHVEAMRTGNPEPFRTFQLLYDIFHLVFLLVLVVGLVFIFTGYAKERIPVRRRALRWIVYGLLIGAAPFLTLVVLPQLWGPDLLAPEELATFFTLAIPLSFIIAFLRYHVFSIEIQHRQGLTTFLLRMSLSLLQLLFAAIVLSVFWEDVLFGSHVLEMLAFGLFLLLLTPVRSRLASLIEEAVFPSRFNPTRLLQDVSSRFHGILVPSDVGPVLVSELHHIIPRFAFLWYAWGGRAFMPRRSSDPMFLPSLDLSPHVADEIRNGRFLAVAEAVRPPLPAVGQSEQWLREHTLSFALPLRDAKGSLLGLLCARKNAGVDPLDRGELELIRTLSLQASSVMEHLSLQENMMLEQRRRKELEELSRLKSHFVSSVSHDLRTPLTSMGMFLELLEKPRLTAAKRGEYIGVIRQEAQRLRRLVENVLDFARAERGVREFSRERTDLTKVLRQAADAMAGQFKAVNARYQVRIPASLPPIIADPFALERAFVNILSNAYKYTPSKKSVSFMARQIDGSVRIIIADNGFGISEAELSKVFDPFYRVRDRSTAPTGGVGLGLSLVKRTIEYHGGRVSIRSRKGKGTTVTVDLPVEFTTSAKE